MSEAPLLPRLVRHRLDEALDDSPVVLIHGPRQSGKTTLALEIAAIRGYSYYSFDDDNIRRAAQSDPVGFVADLPEYVVLDEVQRLPDLFTTLKASIDSHRTPGRFLLTGSSNVLMLPTLADSLAGRMEIIPLLPLSQVELNSAEPWFLGAVRAAEFPTRRGERLGPVLADLLVAGGYPAALARNNPKRRAAWYRNFVDTLVQRDVRDLANIARTDILPRLLELAASQTARLLNVSDLSGPFQVSRPTIRDYMTLLERLFLIDEQPAWHQNRLSRLVKSPKLHIGDTGLGAALMRLDAASLYEDRRLMGQLLETFVYQELRKQSVVPDCEAVFFHYRDKDQVEVDIVLEFDGRRIGGVEVKASSTLSDSDFLGLRKLSRAVGPRFTAGVVVYDGEHTLSFGERLFAVPVSTIWQPTSSPSIVGHRDRRA